MPTNFTFREMLITSSGLPNIPETWEQLHNIEYMANQLQIIRSAAGFPIKVNSAFRSPAVNKAAGGVKTSAHTKGLAADICGSSEARNRRIYELCEKLPSFDQLIMYNVEPGNPKSKIRFIHLGFREGPPRKQKLFK